MNSSMKIYFILTDPEYQKYYTEILNISSIMVPASFDKIQSAVSEPVQNFNVGTKIFGINFEITDGHYNCIY